MRIAAVLCTACLLAGCRDRPQPATTRPAAGSAATRPVGGPYAGATPTGTAPANGFARRALPPPTRSAAGSRRDRTGPDAGCLVAGCHAGLQATEHVHGPVMAGDCGACHGPEQPGHLFPLVRQGDAVCAHCHRTLTGKPFLHGALRTGGCISCHDPHGASNRLLLTADSTVTLCRQCHPDSSDAVSRHEPFAAGACTVCHLAHEADNAALTVRSGPDHCFQCHAELGERMRFARTAHGPAVQSCTICHSPHAAPAEKLLVGPGADGCACCHSEVDARARTAASPHGAVFTEKSCLNCHDVHAADGPWLLRAPMPELCLTCHDRPQVAYDGRTLPEMRTQLTASEFLHGPIRSGECQVCHRAHGSSNSRLLERYFPDAFYAGFDLANYALCFMCHEQALVLDQRTTTLTDFRNGDRNLHYVHVHRAERGRSCITCHEIHASNRPMHMAEHVPFERGGWALPINFQKTATGGSCAPGCHAPYEYDREQPRVYSPQP